MVKNGSYADNKGGHPKKVCKLERGEEGGDRAVLLENVLWLRNEGQNEEE